MPHPILSRPSRGDEVRRLQELLNDPSADVREAAEQTLKKLAE